MKLSDEEMLKMAVEVAKSFFLSPVARGNAVQDVIDATYKKIKELNETNRD